MLICAYALSNVSEINCVVYGVKWVNLSYRTPVVLRNDIRTDIHKDSCRSDVSDYTVGQARIMPWSNMSLF